MAHGTKRDGAGYKIIFHRMHDTTVLLEILQTVAGRTRATLGVGIKTWMDVGIDGYKMGQVGSDVQTQDDTNVTRVHVVHCTCICLVRRSYAELLLLYAAG